MARRRRSGGWGSRHPRIALSISAVVMAILVLVSIADLVAGSYQGLVWWLCGAAGIVAGVGLAAWLVRNGRRSARQGRPQRTAMTVLTVASVIAIRSGFPHGQYAGAGEFFNLLRAVLVGYGIVHWSLVEWYVVRAIPRAIPRPPVVYGKAGPGSAEMKVSLRFPGVDPAGRQGTASWRPGRLIAANGTVTWVSRKGGAPVDLTGASLAPDTVPPTGRPARSRTTILMTAQGPAELKVAPSAVAELFPVPGLQ